MILKIRDWAPIVGAVTLVFAASGCSGVPGAQESGGLQAAGLPPELKLIGLCAQPAASPDVQAEVDAAIRGGTLTVDGKPSGGGGGGTTTPTVVTVPVYVHVIRLAAAGTGDIDLAMITNQIAVLNASYGGATGGPKANFQFDLVSVDRTTNASWYNCTPGSTAEAEMKQVLRLGGKNALNVYTTGGGGYLGWSTYPWNYSVAAVKDGLVLRDQTLPGGSAAPFNAGDSAVHEVGHWLGLYHTYEGGCTKTGDSVSDTPSEATPASGCPSGRDSCNKVSGLDPIQNFMDDTDDSCRYLFTTGQVSRMASMWTKYRA